LNKKSKQNIHGVVLLDKPAGMSSNRALQRVKYLFNAKKAGHTGSLDPLATGLLPICFGQATKVSEYFLKSHKKYQTVIKLGEVTDTLDSEGEVTEKYDVTISDQQIEQALGQFRGQIKQIPPMYSALKKDGQPLYKRARKGEVIERPARDMTVFSLTAKRIDERHVGLHVHCSSGFYIRSLAHDLGRVLGCGAHVTELRRTQIKQINVAQAYRLEQLEQLENCHSALQAIDSLLLDMPLVTLSEQQVMSLAQGRVTDAGGQQPVELARFYQPNGKLFAVGSVTESGRLKTRKIFVEAD